MRARLLAQPHRVGQRGRGRRAISTTSALSIAASLPIPPIAMPTVARASAGASLTPSPTMATAPCSRLELGRRRRTLSSGSSAPWYSSTPRCAARSPRPCARCRPRAAPSRGRRARLSSRDHRRRGRAHLVGGGDHAPALAAGAPASRSAPRGSSARPRSSAAGGTATPSSREQLRRADLDRSRRRRCATRPLPRCEVSWSAGSTSSAARLGRAHHRLGERMLRALLGARRPAPATSALGAPSQRDDVGDLEAPARERAGLVERHRLHPPERLDEAAALEQHAVARRVRDRREDGGRASRSRARTARRRRAASSRGRTTRANVDARAATAGSRS